MKAFTGFKYTIIAMISIICISFYGCGSNGTDNDNTADTDKNTGGNITKEEMQDEVTLKFHYQDWYTHPDFKTVLQDVNDKVLRELSSRVEFIKIDNISFNEEILRIIMSGDDFDAFCMTDMSFSIWMDVLQSKGILPEEILLDISDMFPRYAPSLYGKFTDEELDEVSYDGMIMAVPPYIPGSGRICAVVMEELREKYDVPEITDYDDFEKYLEALKEHEYITPFLVVSNTCEMFADKYGYVNLDPGSRNNIVYRRDDRDMTLMPWEETPAFMEAYETLQRWHLNGYVYENLDKSSYSIWDITLGKFGSFVSTWDNIKSFIYHLSVRDELRVYPLYVDSIATKTPYSSCFIAFNKNAANPERAMQFIEWTQSCQENYDLMIYGIEDKQYTMEGDRMIPNMGRTYFWSGSLTFANFDWDRSLASIPGEDKEELLEVIRDGSNYPPSFGFKPDYSHIAELNESRVNSVASMEDAIGTKGIFDTGIKQFIKEQKELGVGRLINELQRQLDKWESDKTP